MSFWARPPFAALCWAISRMVFTDSCLAESMKLQVLTTRISASSALKVSSPPARLSRPIMTSESTRFLGQPSETKPIFGRAGVVPVLDSEEGFRVSVEASTTKDGTRLFYRFEEDSGPRRPLITVLRWVRVGRLSRWGCRVSPDDCRLGAGPGRSDLLPSYPQTGRRRPWI